MKRYAAHYIYLSGKSAFKQHYIELNDQDCIRGVFPLQSEIAETTFHNGILFAVPENRLIAPQQILQELKDRQLSQPQASVFELLNQIGVAEFKKNVPVCIFQLDGIELHSLKLGYHSGYIQKI